MPSAYSAENNVALVATCSACQRSVPTALMVNLTGSHNSRSTYSAVCLACAGKGWRPAGFAGVYQWQQR